MALFNFITDDDFRNSLEADFSEMNKCMKVEAWKAVHVLSGSLLESLLSDSLLAEGIIKKKDVVSLDLGKAIKYCVSNKIISSKTADLSSVVKDYRNLIHPGRGIRLEEEVSSDSATVAESVVRIIIGEIAKHKRKNYGYTAEQIAEKIERDSTSTAIMAHILKDTKNIEKERLMLKILPQKYLTTLESEWHSEHELPAFINCFHTAYDQSDYELQKKVATWFVTLLKEEGDRAVFSYVTAFMRFFFLVHLTVDEQSLIKEHFLSRLDKNITDDLLTALECIGIFLEKEDINKFIDPLARLACSDEKLSSTAKNLLTGECSTLSYDGFGLTALERFDDWIGFYESKGLDGKVVIMEDIKNSCNIVPF